LLGVRSVVTSPTFGLARGYTLRRQPWQRVVHIDAYRIRGQHEHPALELRELLADPTVLLLVEWPERLVGLGWGRHWSIRLDHRRSGRRAVIQLRRR
jgi:tRNA threonylcarbamoyladenosine biosynthesis protein TsaE